MSILPLGFSVIYALVDPCTGLVRYVGNTINPDKRFREHIYRHRKTPKMQSWIQELAAKNMTPIFVFLDSIKTETAMEIEKEWINHFNELSPLLNFQLK